MRMSKVAGVIVCGDPVGDEIQTPLPLVRTNILQKPELELCDALPHNLFAFFFRGVRPDVATPIEFGTVREVLRFHGDRYWPVMRLRPDASSRNFLRVLFATFEVISLPRRAISHISAHSKMCCTGSCAAIATAAKVATAREITTPHKAAAREKHCTTQHLTTKGFGSVAQTAAGIVATSNNKRNDNQC